MSSVRERMVGNWSSGNLFHLIPGTGEICQGKFPLCHSLPTWYTNARTHFLSRIAALRYEVWHLSFQSSLSWSEREIEGMYYWFHVAQLTSPGCHAHVALLAMLISKTTVCVFLLVKPITTCSRSHLVNQKVVGLHSSSRHFVSCKVFCPVRSRKSCYLFLYFISFRIVIWISNFNLQCNKKGNNVQ